MRNGVDPDCYSDGLIAGACLVAWILLVLGAVI
jgi:hypothetical protein